MSKCTLPHGVVIKPDGINDLDPCQYRLTEIHKNVTVEVLRCPNCGAVSIAWLPQEDTEDIYLDSR